MRFCSILILLLGASHVVLAGESSYKKVSAEEYNYKLYLSSADWRKGIQFKEGMKFPQASVYSLSADKFIQTGDLFKKGRPVVIEVGSVTCPIAMYERSEKNSLYEQFKGKVDFYTLYVRENHPRPNIPHHTSMKDKIERAKYFEKVEKPLYSTLVDTFEGDLHQMLGNRPNVTFVIGKNGIVFYQSLESKVPALKLMLSTLLANGGAANGLGFISNMDLYDRNDPKVKASYKRIIDRAGHFSEHFTKKHDEAKQKLEKVRSSKYSRYETETQKIYNELSPELTKQYSSKK